MTVINETVGGTTPDHATLAISEASTPTNLVAAGDQYNFLMRDAVLGNGSIQPMILNDTTSALYYRTWSPDAGVSNYNIADDSGPRFSTSHDWNIVDLEEPYAQITGLGIFKTGTGSESSQLCRVIEDGTLLDGCSLRSERDGTFILEIGRYAHSYTATVMNCIIRVIGSPTDKWGIRVGADDARLYNNIIYNASGNGIGNTGPDGGIMINNIVMGSGSSDYSIPAPTQSYNLSEDTTATGTGSLTSQTIADIFTDAANNDFSLASGSNAEDAGDELNATFTSSYNGVDRGSANWDMGALQTAAAASGASQAYLFAMRRAQIQRQLRM